MKKVYHTEVREFDFQGLSKFWEQQFTLFVMFLALYILTLADNVIMVTITCIEHHLHIPM